MQAVQFAPATLKVKRGDVVVWTNRDPFPHTATAAGVFDIRSRSPRENRGAGAPTALARSPTSARSIRP